MITLEFTDAATMEQQAVQAGLTLPIEHTAVTGPNTRTPLTDVRRGVRMW